MRAHDLAVREAAVHAVTVGQSAAAVARALGIGPDSVRRYVRQQREQGHLRPGTSGNRHRLIGTAQEAAFRALLAQHPTASADELCGHWATVSGTQVSLATMQRTLARLHWVRSPPPWPGPPRPRPHTYRRPPVPRSPAMSSTARRPYATDLTDAEWALLSP